MAKNSEVYKTAQERAEAFGEFCTKVYNEPCINEKCIFRKKHFSDDCPFHWLDLEAEEKMLPCPFCGDEMVEIDTPSGTDGRQVICSCGYGSRCCSTREKAIAAHNRVAKKCREGKE